MAKGKTHAVTMVNVNNAKAATTVSVTVEAVVKNGQLVPDTNDTESGVIMR